MSLPSSSGGDGAAPAATAAPTPMCEMRKSLQVPLVPDCGCAVPSIADAIEASKSCETSTMSTDSSITSTGRMIGHNPGLWPSRTADCTASTGLITTRKCPHSQHESVLVACQVMDRCSLEEPLQVPVRRHVCGQHGRGPAAQGQPETLQPCQQCSALAPQHPAQKHAPRTLQQCHSSGLQGCPVSPAPTPMPAVLHAARKHQNFSHHPTACFYVTVRVKCCAMQYHALNAEHLRLQMPSCAHLIRAQTHIPKSA